MISSLSFNETVERIKNWSNGEQTRLVFCCTLNEIMEAEENVEFGKLLKAGDLLTPDGMPLVWWLRWQGKKVERVYGPEILQKFIILNLKFKNRMVFVGDEKNRDFFEKYGDYIVMPMRQRFEKEDYDVLIKSIGKVSGGKIVWLGLGARKQIEVASELKRRKIGGVVVTVGAAFDFISGNKKQAPRWIRQAGGEWLFRLIMEPKRLGQRYFKIISWLLRRICGRKLQLIY